MLELFVIFGLCKQVGVVARSKGRRAFWYQLMTAFAWFGGEIVGGIITAVIAALVNPAEEAPLGVIYLGALAGAAISVGFVFFLAHGLPTLPDRERDFPRDYVPENSPLAPDTGNPYQAPRS